MPRNLRDPKLEQFWRGHLSRQPASGLTTREYCRKHALREGSFYAWRRIIGERDQATRDQAAHATHDTTPRPGPAFLPVAFSEPQARHSAAAIDIQLANGCRIRVRSGCDRSLLADVLAILHASARTEARPC
jgi:hypothetical protein